MFSQEIYSVSFNRSMEWSDSESASCSAIQFSFMGTRDSVNMFQF